MLAGFESPSSGQILIDGKDMSDVPPYERPTNMMFQNYALFPHMTVEKNIAFGLQQDGLAKGEIRDRIDDILRLVELQDFKKRRPQQLSGGQRQRVALARALVKEPKLLLLDEPLGALDKKLREQTQFELVNIQEKVGVTFVVVTHDQEEAMTLSSRIAVMHEGKFVQIGSPTEIYEFPENRLVADFIGSANIFDGTVIARSGKNLQVATEIGNFYVESAVEVSEGSEVYYGIRPEKIHLSMQTADESEENKVVGIIDDIGYLGNNSRYKVRISNNYKIDVTVPNQVRPKNLKHHISLQDEVYLNWDASSAMLLKK